MELTVIQPYDDKKLNYVDEKYELTTEYVKEQLDIHFSDDETLVRRIKKNTRKVYRVIFARINTYNRKVVEYVLNNTEQGRRWLFDLLFTQFEADNETGFNDLSEQPAINFQNGQVVDRKELYRNQLSVDAEQILVDVANYCGINLLFAGVLDARIN